jgi:hypothetical protein
MRKTKLQIILLSINTVYLILYYMNHTAFQF